MFSKLLLVLGISFGYGSNLMVKVNNNYSHTPNSSRIFSYINYDSPAYRLGDYDITTLEHISAGDGQVRFNHIQAIIPRVVFDTLGEFENVFISMPLYDYNSTVDLEMKLEYYDNGVHFSGFFLNFEWIPLSATMLKVLPYTMVDLSYEFNPFDYNNWYVLHDKEIRISFIIPYTEHTNPPSGWQDDLRNITLFTKRGDDYAGGYDDGYYDGFLDGTDEGYIGGYTDGLQDGYEVGFQDAETVGDGTWLGNLVFGTIGGIVGFLFALSDFEVLGVSIMSIITLFVAIGIVKLLLKVLK